LHIKLEKSIRIRIELLRILARSFAELINGVRQIPTGL
jgi:hypothetical protein